MSLGNRYFNSTVVQLEGRIICHISSSVYRISILL